MIRVLFPEAVTDPGFGVSHATHFVSPGLFRIMQVAHSHDPSGVLNFSPQPGKLEELADTGGIIDAPGLEVVQATHF